MAWFTSEDWTDIRGTLLGALAVLLCFSAMSMWKNHKDGLPVINFGNIIQQLPNLYFLFFVVLMLPIMDIADRHGLGWWTIPLGGILFAIPAVILGKFQMNHARKNALPNPNAGPVSVSAASPEEARVNLKLNMLLIAFAIATIGPVSYVALNAKDIGEASMFTGAFIAFAALAVFVWALVGRWPGDVKKSSTIEINASPEDIWNTIFFRATTSWWKEIVSRVEPLDANGKRFRLHYFNNGVCATCGLPQDPDSPGRFNDVEILENAHLRRLAWRAWPHGTGGAMERLMDYEEESFDLEPIGNATTRVIDTNRACRPRAWLAIILKLGNPSRENLKTLKAHMEGTSSDSVFEAGAGRIREARHAEKFCGCPQGTASSGLLG